LKPYQVLSTGEKFRCDVARKLKDNSVIDEFTSVVNRECALSCSVSISKYIKRNNLKNIVFASCHDDIIDYLQPDWVYNTDKKELSVGRCASKRPEIVLEVNQCSNKIWSMFAPYHYLTHDLNTSADCYLASYNMLPIAFGAVICMPGRFPNPLDANDNRKCVSEHRTVVLPDYQGIGIGKKLSEYMAELYISQGYRYFSKTANPIIGEYRERSNKWRATSSNLKKIKNIDDITEEEVLRAIRPKGRDSNYNAVIRRMTRLCYSHEYIGDENTVIGKCDWNKSKVKKLF
jgi:GNAT superfamily N-acetyltransferase